MEIPGAERLHEVPVGTTSRCGPFRSRVTVERAHDDGQGREVLSQIGDRVQALGDRELNLEHDGVRPESGNRLPGANRAVRISDHGHIPILLDDVGGELPALIGTVDHQDAHADVDTWGEIRFGFALRCSQLGSHGNRRSPRLTEAPSPKMDDTEHTTPPRATTQEGTYGRFPNAARSVNKAESPRPGRPSNQDQGQRSWLPSRGEAKMVG